MRILVVTPYLPSPPRFGGQRRMHGLLRELASKHQISVLSLYDTDVDQTEALEQTRAYCRRVVTVPGRKRNARGAVKRLLQVASIASPWSYEAIAYREVALQRALEAMLREEPVDVLQFEFAHMGVYRWPAGGPWTTVLDEHNVEYDVVRRTAQAEVGAVRRAYSALDWRKLRREERASWRRFHGTVVTSARDREALLADEPETRTALVPNGVDVDSFSPSEGEVAPDTVLFFGAIDYYPNTDGLLFFLREVWPLIKAQRPAVRLRIVGPNPPPNIARWPDPSVEVTGYVDDVRLEIARAAVVVAPLRIGGGTRLKVLEAMALGKAVVSTTLGAEGIDVTDGMNVLLADQPSRFADNVTALLADAPRRASLGASGRRLIVERYSWRSAAGTLARFYEELMSSGPAAAPR